MKVYIAGPMTGYPEWNYPAFHAKAEELRQEGHEVVNPAEHFDGRTDLPRWDYIRAALSKVLEDDVDVIVVLDGWEKSIGANLEVKVARELGIGVYRHEGKDSIRWYFVPPEAEPTNAPPRAELLDEAKHLITGDRNATYGPPTQDFQRTADAATAYGYRGPCGRDLQPHDVAVLVMLVKLSRLMWSPEKRDHWVDLAGYAGCGHECVVEEK